MNAYRKLTLAGLRGFFRDRSALFFSFFFPIFFILLFGSLFGESDKADSKLKFSVGLVMEAESPVVAWVPGVFQKIPVLEMHQGNADAELKELRNGKRRAVIIFPKEFSKHVESGTPTDVRVLYDHSQQQASQIALGVVRRVLNEMEKQMSGHQSLLEAKEEAITSEAKDGPKLRQIDYMIPGILAMTVMQLGVFTAIPLVNMREKGILKRLGATPLPRRTLIASQITMRLIISIFQTLLLLVIGMTLFQFHVIGSWLGLLGLVAFGSLTFIALGAVLASVAKTQESAAPLVQLTNLPMLFLSGMLFPPELMPAYLRPVTDAIPATHLAEAMRAIVVSSPSPHGLGMNFAVMGAWLVGCLLVSMRIFRWE